VVVQKKMLRVVILVGLTVSSRFVLKIAVVLSETQKISPLVVAE
jgi:hypothetical protein